AGIPLMQALDALEEQAPVGRRREVVRGAAMESSEGRKFSEALARHPDLFSPAYRGIVGNGELTGRLDLALERLAAFLQRDLEMRQKIRDMLIYPGLVLVMAGVVLTIFLMFIIPAFDRIYRTAGASLPLLTRILVEWSRAFRAGLPLLAAAVAALRRSINNGRRFTEAMRDTRWFSPMFVRIASIGEETGRLDAMMGRAAVILDRDLDLRLKRLMTFLEPALTLLIGAFVGVVLLALYLPIFGLSKALLH